MKEGEAGSGEGASSQSQTLALGSRLVFEMEEQL